MVHADHSPFFFGVADRDLIRVPNHLRETSLPSPSPALPGHYVAWIVTPARPSSDIRGGQGMVGDLGLPKLGYRQSVAGVEQCPNFEKNIAEARRPQSLAECHALI